MQDPAKEKPTKQSANRDEPARGTVDQPPEQRRPQQRQEHDKRGAYQVVRVGGVGADCAARHVGVRRHVGALEAPDLDRVEFEGVGARVEVEGHQERARVGREVAGWPRAMTLIRVKLSRTVKIRFDPAVHCR